MSTTSDELNLIPRPEEARVKRIASPIASPAVCAICSKNKHEKGFADPGLVYEFYGNFYLCGDCVGDFARVFGYLDPKQALQLAQRIQQLEQDIQIHREALLHLESSVEHLTDYRILRNANPNITSDVNVSGSADASPETPDEASGGTVFTFPTGTNEAESNISKPVEQQGPNDIPGDSSNSSAVDIIDL